MRRKQQEAAQRRTAATRRYNQVSSDIPSSSNVGSPFHERHRN